MYRSTSIHKGKIDFPFFWLFSSDKFPKPYFKLKDFLTLITMKV